MKSTLSIVILFLFTTSTKAYFIPMTLYSMALNAEKIVYGEIISLDSLTFTINIENSLTGETGRLTIEKFGDYACAHRWTEYQIGQKVFLFLWTFKGRLMTMGGGNEGELPLFQDSVIISGLSLPSAPPEGLSQKKLEKWPNKIYFESKRQEIYGDTFYGHRVSLPEFITTIKSLKECFQQQPNYYGENITSKIICNNDIIEKKLKTDKIFRWTYGELTK
jgi:hypothetical protein